MRRAAILIFCLWFCLEVRAQPNLKVDLQVQDSTEAEVYNDQPVRFTVTLANPEAHAFVLWNIANERALRELKNDLQQGKITREQYDQEAKQTEQEKRKIEPLILGSDSRPWFTQLEWFIEKNEGGQTANISVMLLHHLEPPPVITLDEKSDATAYFGISPEGVGKLEPAAYTIRVVINGVESNRVLLKVRKEQTPISFNFSEAPLLDNGRYYLLAGEPDKTIVYANWILNKNRASLSALVLRGEAYAQQEKYEPAENDFRAALALFYKQEPNSSEPPEFLLGMLEWIKEKRGMK